MRLTPTKMLQRCAGLLGLIATLLISGCANNNIPERPKSILPAQFSDSPVSLQNRILFPDVKEDVSATVRCLALIDRKGWVRGTVCYVPDSSPHYIKMENAIRRAGRGARIKPARLDRKSIGVWKPFSVHFVQQNGEQGILITPNFGIDVDRFGSDYFAPQRRELKRGEKQGRFSKGCTFHTKLWVEVEVDAGGVPLASEYPVGIGTDACKERIKREILHARFIPAIANQQPVAATSLVPFFDVRNSKHKLDE